MSSFGKASHVLEGYENQQDSERSTAAQQDLTKRNSTWAPIFSRMTASLVFWIHLMLSVVFELRDACMQKMEGPHTTLFL